MKTRINRRKKKKIPCKSSKRMREKIKAKRNHRILQKMATWKRKKVDHPGVMGKRRSKRMRISSN